MTYSCLGASALVALASADAENPFPPAPSRLTADIVEDLALRVASARSGGDGTIVVLGFDEDLPCHGENPPDQDTVDAWFDLIGLGDHAIKGERIHLRLTIVRDGFTRFIGRPLGFEVSGAWSTPICSRGLTADGLCV